MIPPLDDDGYLPPGIHTPDLDEIEPRFGRGSELRQVEMESIRWLVDLARRAGVQRIVIEMIAAETHGVHPWEEPRSG